MPIRILFWLGMFSLTLAGCASRPTGPEGTVNLPAQIEQLSQIHTWQAQGKMAIRNHKEAVSATLNWKVDGNDFDFRLTNFLGVTLVDMTAEDGLVTLEADDETYQDTDASWLIYQVTGWSIPIEPLMQWVKGVPLATDQYTLNEHGLLATLVPGCAQCGQWQIGYGDYQAEGEHWLPHAITLTQTDNPNNWIKVRIRSWTLKPN